MEVIHNSLDGIGGGLEGHFKPVPAPIPAGHKECQGHFFFKFKKINK